MLDISHEYTISEVSEITGYAPHVLRFYEKEFDIQVPRTDSNHRYYTYKEVELIQYIKNLQEKGFTNKQIKLIIQSPEIMMTTPDNSTSNLVATTADTSYLDTYQIAKEISMVLEEDFFEKLSSHILEGSERNEQLILDLKDEIVKLRIELNSMERDVLLCENARVKMEMQELLNKNNELTNQLEKIQSSKGFFKKIFSNKATGR